MQIKIFRTILIIGLVAAIILIFNAFLLPLFDGLILIVRHALPAASRLSTIILYFETVVSIAIIAFSAGFFHLISTFIIRWGIILYICYNIFTSLLYYIPISSTVGQFSMHTFIWVMSYNIIVLFIGIVIARPLYVGGTKLRDRFSRNLNGKPV
jgi:hypothetical protein